MSDDITITLSREEAELVRDVMGRAFPPSPHGFPWATVLRKFGVALSGGGDEGCAECAPVCGGDDRCGCACHLPENRAGVNPTIYAKLMDFALDEPRREIYRFIDKELRQRVGDLGELLVEQLRQAYTAGVADGYREAAIDGRVPGQRAALADEEGGDA